MTVTNYGSYWDEVTAVTLTEGASITLTHNLGATPEANFNVKGTAGTATFRGAIAVTARTTTLVVIKNTGGDTVNCEGYIFLPHSVQKSA